MDLTTSLRAAAGEPPPTSIDLDRLIRAEQRRAYRQRRLFGAGLVSGVAVLVGAASLGWPLGARAPVGDGEAAVCPWVSPSGGPSVLPPLASASGAGPSMSFVAPSGNASPPPSGDPSPTVGGSDSPNVEASGSPVSPPPAAGSASPAMPPSPPPPSASASWLGPVPSAPAPGRSPIPDRSPAGVCADTLRRLEHVLTDALARIAPDARPTTPIRFFSYPDGSVRAVVMFAGDSHLEVILFPLWEADLTVRIELSLGGAYQLHPGHGLLIAVTTDGPLHSAQAKELASEPGLTLTS